VTDTNGKFFYGWIIALASAVGVACNFSLWINATTGIFAGPLGADLGWTRDAIMKGTLYASVPAILAGPIAGALVDRFGARRVLFFSYLAQVFIWASFYRMGSDVNGLYWRYALVCIACHGTTNVSYVKLIGLWFNRRRGMALGIVLGGVGVGGAIWSKLTQYLIDQYGWRMAYLVMAGIIAVIVLPALMILVRNTPAEKGTTVDGLPEAPGAAGSPALAGYTLANAARIPHYWILVLSLLFIGIAIQAVQVNMVPLLGTHGMPPQIATTVQASLWIAIVFGRLSTGWLMDRYFAPRVAICYMLAPMLGLVLLATQSSMGTSLVAAICMGLASGAEIDVIAYLVSRYFGLRFYSRIYGTFYATYGVAAFIGPYYASRIATSAGNDYTPALWACLASLVIGTLLMMLLPRFPRELPTTG
jgi:MFS family permease